MTDTSVIDPKVEISSKLVNVATLFGSIVILEIARAQLVNNPNMSLFEFTQVLEQHQSMMKTTT